MCPFDIVFRELERVAERVVDMRLCSKVQDGVNIFLSEYEADQVGRSDVALDELKV